MVVLWLDLGVASWDDVGPAAASESVHAIPNVSHTMILVDGAGLAVRRPDRPLFEDLSVTVSSGDRLAAVGINGTGKSTLLRVLAGDLEPEAGAVRRGRGVRVGFLGQRPSLPSGTVRAAVGEEWEAAAVLERLGMGPLADVDVSTLSGGQAKRVA